MSAPADSRLSSFHEPSHGGGAYFGELSQGSFRSKNSGTPTLSLSISSIWAFSSGVGSLRSPSLASSSDVKYRAIVLVLSGWDTPRLPIISGRNAAHSSEFWFINS